MKERSKAWGRRGRLRWKNDDWQTFSNGAERGMTKCFVGVRDSSSWESRMELICFSSSFFFNFLTKALTEMSRCRYGRFAASMSPLVIERLCTAQKNARQRKSTSSLQFCAIILLQFNLYRWFFLFLNAWKSLLSFLYLQYSKVIYIHFTFPGSRSELPMDQGTHPHPSTQQHRPYCLYRVYVNRAGERMRPRGKAREHWGLLPEEQGKEVYICWNLSL